MGRSTVEREGVSVAHASRIVLVGTMNPEEGELRPQLLDRFGLTVEIAAPRDPQLRAEVVRRRMAFDADPAAFAGHVRRRRSRPCGSGSSPPASSLARSRLGDDQLLKIAEVCAAFEVDGMRADIVTARAAVAHAAWHGRTDVERRDIRAAARLALPHRRRRNPFDAPGLDEDLLDQLLGEERAGAGSARPAGRRPAGPGSGPGPGTRTRTTRPRRPHAGAPAVRPSLTQSTPSPADRRRRRVGCRTGRHGRRGVPDPAVHRGRGRSLAKRAGAAGRSPRSGRTVGARPADRRARTAPPAGHHPGRRPAAGPAADGSVTSGSG